MSGSQISIGKLQYPHQQHFEHLSKTFLMVGQGTWVLDVTCILILSITRKSWLPAGRFFLGGVSGDLRGFQFKGVGPCDFRRPRENDNEVPALLPGWAC